MCFLPTPLNQHDGIGAAAQLPQATYPSYVLGVDDSGVLAWNPRRPRPDVGRVVLDYGTDRIDTHTLLATSSGTGVQTGPVGGRYQLGGTLSSVGSTGRAARSLKGNSFDNIVFDTTSGTWTYDVLFTLPILPTVANAYRLLVGFIDSSSALPTDGACVLLDQNDTAFQCITRSNGTETRTDSGVTATAGQAYRVHIRVTNDSSVSFYIVADAAGAQFGAAKATHSTNIPSGAGRETSGGIYYQQTAGTARQVNYFYQQFVQRAPGSNGAPASMVAPGILNPGDGLGVALGGVGTRYQMDRSEPSIPAFTDPELPIEVLPFDMVWTRGVTNRRFFEQGSLTAVSAALEDFIHFTYTLASGSTTTRGYVSDWHGNAAPADVPGRVFDNDSGSMIYEALVYVDTLSTATNRVVLRAGWNDSVSGAPANSVHVELDSFVDGEFQCVTRAASSETRTDSGITASAATWYQIRIVVTNDDSVDFYIRAFGTAWGSPVATHTTNIPSGTGQAVGPAFQCDTAATSNAATRIVRGGHIRAYQRLAS